MIQMESRAKMYASLICISKTTISAGTYYLRNERGNFYSFDGKVVASEPFSAPMTVPFTPYVGSDKSFVPGDMSVMITGPSDAIKVKRVGTVTTIRVDHARTGVDLDVNVEMLEGDHV